MKASLKIFCIKNGKPDLDILKKISKNFCSPVGSVKKFRKKLKIYGTEGDFMTPLGKVRIKPLSQYMKMKNCKENRLYLSGNYISTLQDPLFVYEHEKRRFFVGLYWTNKGNPLVHKVALENIDNRWVVKTNFPEAGAGKIEKCFEMERYRIYARSGIDAHLLQDAETSQAQNVGTEDNTAMFVILHKNDKNVKCFNKKIEKIKADEQIANLVKDSSVILSLQEK